MAEMRDKVHWIEVKCIVDGEMAEALAEVLGRFVVNGVVIESVTPFNPHTQENEPTGEIAVFGYLPVDERLEETRQKLEEALWHLGQIASIPKPKYSPIQDQDWMTSWREHYTPVPVGERFLVMPAWINPDQEQTRSIIRINPALAFGTGTHPSTQLCLRLMERHLKPGGNVIDLGCGSGILSIAAIKLGAVHVLGVDIDSQAVRSTIENAELNDLPPGILETGKGSVEEILTGRFSIKSAPLVLVNILAPVITHLFNQGLGDLVTETGILLLSGILAHQLRDVLNTAEEAGFVLVERLSDGDWVSLAMKKEDFSRANKETQ